MRFSIKRRKKIWTEGGMEFKTDRENSRKEPVHRRLPPDLQLLESFRVRKNIEWKEDWKRSEISDSPIDPDGQVAEVFALTKKLLQKTLGPLDENIVEDDSLLEKALREVHGRLPFPIRIVIWKKRYTQFILANRERLIS